MSKSVWMHPYPHGNAPRNCVCAFTVCSASVCATRVTVSTAADTESISLHDNCQCVLSGRFIAPEFGA